MLKSVTRYLRHATVGRDVRPTTVMKTTTYRHTGLNSPMALPTLHEIPHLLSDALSLYIYIYIPGIYNIHTSTQKLTKTEPAS